MSHRVQAVTMSGRELSTYRIYKYIVALYIDIIANGKRNSSFDSFITFK